MPFCAALDTCSISSLGCRKEHICQRTTIKNFKLKNYKTTRFLILMWIMNNHPMIDLDIYNHKKEEISTMPLNFQEECISMIIMREE